MATNQVDYQWLIIHTLRSSSALVRRALGMRSTDPSILKAIENHRADLRIIGVMAVFLLNSRSRSCSYANFSSLPRKFDSRPLSEKLKTLRQSQQSIIPASIPVGRSEILL